MGSILLKVRRCHLVCRRRVNYCGQTQDTDSERCRVSKSWAWVRNHLALQSALIARQRLEPDDKFALRKPKAIVGLPDCQHSKDWHSLLILSLRWRTTLKAM